MQCVVGVVDHAARRIREELLPLYPNVDGVVALEHGYGCGVAIDAPDAIIPIRTVRNLALNPNFGGEVLVVSLGCELRLPRGCCRRAPSRSTTATRSPAPTPSACRTMPMSASCR